MLRTAAGKDWKPVGVHSVSPGYFSVYRIPVLRGRLLSDHDSSGAPQALLLGESAAKHLFPSEDPVGKRVELQSWEDGHWDTEVVGIVGDPTSLAPFVHSAIHALDTDLPLYVETLTGAWDTFIGVRSSRPRYMLS